MGWGEAEAVRRGESSRGWHETASQTADGREGIPGWNARRKRRHGVRPDRIPARRFPRLTPPPPDAAPARPSDLSSATGESTVSASGEAPGSMTTGVVSVDDESPKASVVGATSASAPEVLEAAGCGAEERGRGEGLDAGSGSSGGMTGFYV